MFGLRQRFILNGLFHNLTGIIIQTFTCVGLVDTVSVTHFLAQDLLRFVDDILFGLKVLLAVHLDVSIHYIQDIFFPVTILAPEFPSQLRRL